MPKIQGKLDLIDFQLQFDSECNVWAAHVVPADLDNDIEELKIAESWFFSASAASVPAGVTRLPSAGATGVDDPAQMSRRRKVVSLPVDKESPMASSIAYTNTYTTVLDEVYMRATCSTCLNSSHRIVRAGCNARETMAPKIEVTGLGDYTRNVGYKTGSITYEFETKTFNYDSGIKLLAEVILADM